MKRQPKCQQKIPQCGTNIVKKSIQKQNYVQKVILDRVGNYTGIEIITVFSLHPACRYG